MWGWISKSINRKLVVLLATILIVMALGLGLNSFHQSSTALEDEVEGALGMLSGEGARVIDYEIELLFGELDYASIQPGMEGMVWYYQQEVLKELEERPEILHAGIINERGEMLWADEEKERIPPGDFQQSLLEGESMVSNAVAGEASFMAGVPIGDEEIIGALVVQMSPLFLQEIMQDMGYGEEGYAFIVDSEGTFIADTDHEDRVKDKVNYAEKGEADDAYASKAEIISDMAAGEEGIQGYSFDDQERMIGFISAGELPWSLGIVAQQEEIYAGVEGIFWSIIWGSGIILIIGILSSYAIGRHITDQVVNARRFAEYMSTGNLTKSIPDKILQRKDEIGALGRAFIQLQDDLKGMIETVQNEAKRVESSSINISESTGEMSSGAENQAASIEQLTATMQEMEASIQEVADNTQGASDYSEKVAESALSMSKSLQESAEDLKEAGQQAEETAEVTQAISENLEKARQEGQETTEEMEKASQTTQEGSQQIEKTISDMEQINQTVSRMAEVIGGLGESAEKIGEIIDVIDDISEQTNLLALNASIEAARAGEHGRGFAVVAGAIGDLAQKSQEATQDINELISGIQKEVNVAVESSKEGNEMVKTGSQSVQDAGKAFEDINTAVIKVEEKIESIVDNLSKQAKQSNEAKQTNQQMNELVQKLRSAGEEQSNHTEEVAAMVEKMSELVRDVAAASEEQAASSDEVVKTAENVQAIANENASVSSKINEAGETLKELSQNLRELTEKFVIDEKARD